MAMGQDVLGRLDEQRGGLREASAQAVGNLVQLRERGRVVRLREDRRTRAATGSRAACGTVASRLRMKWTDARDFRLRAPVEAQRFHEVIDLPRGDPCT